jgi:glycosyltransferase involved in cell wall biosynthesis
VRILYLSDIRFPLERANGIQTMETCYALAQRSHEVTLLVRPDTAAVPRDPFAYYGLPRHHRLRVARVDASGGARARRVRYLAAAFRMARRDGHDVVFTRDLGVAAAILFWPRRLRLPVVYESHGLAAIVGAAMGDLLSTGQAASARKQRRLWARERRVWRTAEGYVTITATLAQELEAHFGPRRAIAVVPDGVRLPEPQPFLPLVRTQEPLVAYAGHLYPWKGVDTLLTALASIPGSRGLIVGGHPQEPDLDRLKTMAVSLGLGERVTFTGWVAPAEVARHLTAADVLVLPNSATALSARYSSPLKMFEYLAAGRPIVASDLPAFREVLRDEANALLVPADDASALASAIRRLSEDQELAQRIAETAYAEARAYGWDARAARLESLLRQVVDESRPGASA